MTSICSSGHISRQIYSFYRAGLEAGLDRAYAGLAIGWAYGGLDVGCRRTGQMLGWPGAWDGLSRSMAGLVHELCWAGLVNGLRWTELSWVGLCLAGPWARLGLAFGWAVQGNRLSWAMG
jgi:hypothetical protein